jgi:hypothetical protein
VPRFNEIINNFINGEVSPKVYGRMDSEIYKRSCRELKNMIVFPQGGAARRPGSIFQKKLVPISEGSFFESLNEGARIVPFVFDEDEKYLIIFNKFQGTTFNDNQISFLRVDNDTINWAGMNNQVIQTAGVVASRTSTILSSPRTNDALQNSTVLSEMQYAQAGGFLVFVHESFPPFVIARNAENNLAIDSYFIQFKGIATTNFGPIPFDDLNLSDVAIHASATTVGTGRTLTATSSIFNTGHVGTMFCFQDSGTVGIAIITAYTSGTTVTAEITRALPAAAASGSPGTGGTKNWYEGAWSSFRGWPRTVAYWNNALYFGGSPTFPDRIWKSQTFDIFEMANELTQNPGASPGAAAADPFYATLSAGSGISRIQWMLPGSRDLMVGTNMREYAISNFDRSGVKVTPQTGYGAEYRQAIYIDDTVTYVQRGFRKIREIVYEERRGAYVSPDVTYLAEHMPRKALSVVANPVAPKIKQIAFQTLDNSILWAIDNNGFLFACTKDAANTVTAFHWHDVGGVVESIATLPSKDGTFDELWMIVKRVVNSNTVRYLEKIGNDFSEESLKLGSPYVERTPIFSDSSLVVYRTGEATFFATLISSVDADLANGDNTGAVTGTATFTQGRLNLASASYVIYDAEYNADFTNQGCIRLKVSRGSGTIFSIANSVSSNNNLIRLRWDSGALRLTVNDSGGTPVINDVSFGTVNLGNQDLFLIEVNIDLVNGANRIFVNGKQLGTTNTATGTRSADSTKLTLGANYNNTDALSALFYFFEIYDSVQNTSEYSILNTSPKGPTVWGVDHLEEAEVQVTADGNYIGELPLQGGELQGLAADYHDSSIIVIGKAYESVLEIQPIDIGSGVGSAMGSIKRIDRAVVRFNKSAAASVGPDVNTLEELVFRDSATPADEAIDLVTRDIDLKFLGGYDREARVVVKTRDPLPCNVTCISLRGVTADI